MTQPFTVGGAISKMIVNENTTKEHLSQSEIILKWLQDNTDQLKKTTVLDISNRIFIPEHKNTPKHYAQTIHSLVSKGLILTDSTKKARKPRNFYLNYYHPKMPASIVNEATPEQLAKVKVLTIGHQPNLPKPLETQPIEKSNQQIDVVVPTEKTDQPISLTLNINLTMKG